MGKVKGDFDICAELRKDNPKARMVDLRVVSDTLRVYCEAADNVRRNGAIVLHPRTGAPMENPYLKIQQAAGAALLRTRGLNVDRVMRVIEASLEVSEG